MKKYSLSIGLAGLVFAFGATAVTAENTNEDNGNSYNFESDNWNWTPPENDGGDYNEDDSSSNNEPAGNNSGSNTDSGNNTTDSGNTNENSESANSGNSNTTNNSGSGNNSSNTGTNSNSSNQNSGNTNNSGSTNTNSGNTNNSGSTNTNSGTNSGSTGGNTNWESNQSGTGNSTWNNGESNTGGHTTNEQPQGNTNTAPNEGGSRNAEGINQADTGADAVENSNADVNEANNGANENNENDEENNENSEMNENGENNETDDSEENKRAHFFLNDETLFELRAERLALAQETSEVDELEGDETFRPGFGSAIEVEYDNVNGTMATDYQTILLAARDILEASPGEDPWNGSADEDELTELWAFFLASDELQDYGQSDLVFAVLETHYSDLEEEADTFSAELEEAAANGSGGTGFLGTVRSFFSSIGNLFAGLF